MLRALDEYEIEGVTTLIPFHKAIMATEHWAKGSTCRDLLEDKEWLKSTARRAGRPDETDEDEDENGRARLPGRGRRTPLRRQGPRRRRAAAAPSRRRGRGRPRSPSAERKSGGGGGGGDDADLAAAGQHVEGRSSKQGADGRGGRSCICIIEAMKMENEITAHKAGMIAELPIEPGQSVSAATRSP